MKILLLGKNGQVGWELQRALSPLGQLIALGREFNGDLCGDLSRPGSLVDSLRAVAPDVIVNAAAYTAVDRAEEDPEAAQAINGDAVAVMAQEARRLGALLVHYSTDYVFDGSGSNPWREDDVVAPLSVYGRTKLAGEQAIRGSGSDHLIFRTSWVYAACGQNFARTMLRLAGEREQLGIVADQIGAPTGADLIADVTAHALRAAHFRPERQGLYHLAAAGETSWHDYARFVFDHARSRGRSLALRDLKAIPSSDYPTPARRPLNSRLDTAKLCEAFGLVMPDWRVGVARMLDEILEN